MTTTKIILNAFDDDERPITLLLDKSVSFVFRKSSYDGRSYFSVSALDGVYSIEGDFIEMMNDIEVQVSDIISEEKNKR